jgi:Brp/Blh family beta-carotene 15,15'-monooxygenase
MSKYSNFAIVASFLGLWVNSFFTSEFQIFVGFILIFSFGILHGANDLLLIEHVNTKKELSFFKILKYYISIIAIGAALFFMVPLFAFLLFIIVSGYHFGEQHWEDLKINKNKLVLVFFQFSYGSLILVLLFNFHIEEVKKIIYQITRISFSELYIPLILVCLVISLLFSGSYLYLKNESFKRLILINIFYLLVFTILFKTASLIWGFAIYFILWHSIPSILGQLKFLYGESNFTNFKTYFLKAFVYWIVSLIGIGILYILLKDKQVFDALFFSFLAAITFPHALVITKMFNQNRLHKKAE